MIRRVRFFFLYINTESFVSWRTQSANRFASLDPVANTADLERGRAFCFRVVRPGKIVHFAREILTIKEKKENMAYRELCVSTSSNIFQNFFFPYYSPFWFPRDNDNGNELSSTHNGQAKINFFSLSLFQVVFFAFVRDDGIGGKRPSVETGAERSGEKGGYNSSASGYVTILFVPLIPLNLSIKFESSH